MKLSFTISSLLLAVAAAVPLAHDHHHHNIAKRDVVTRVVQQTQYFYQKQVVYVNQDGVPFSTGWEFVSTATANNAQPQATDSVEAVSTSSQVVVQETSAPQPTPESTSTPESTPEPTPSTTSTPESTPEPTPSTTSTPESTPEPTPSTTSTPESTPEPTTSTPESTPEPTPSTTSTPESTPEPTPSSTEPASTPSATPAAPAQGADTVAGSSSGSGSSSSSGSGDYSGDGTYYDVGLGACGITNVDTDYVVAISHERFDAVGTPNPNNNPLCGKKITAYYGGKSVQVTVVDRCPGCSQNSLDLSPTAFQQLSDLGAGRIGITWSFDS